MKRISISILRQGRALFVVVVFLGAALTSSGAARGDTVDGGPDGTQPELEQLVYDLDSTGDPQAALADWQGGALAAAQTVFPPDGRSPILDTTLPGWRAIVFLLMYDGDVLVSSCSGSMLNYNVVLTAAHCLFSRTGGGYHTKVLVVPAAYPPYRTPFGVSLDRKSVV